MIKKTMKKENKKMWEIIISKMWEVTATQEEKSISKVNKKE